MRLRFSWPAIPTALAALVLWAVVGSWYVELVPDNLSGADNIGIILSTFGACLFLADRIAYFWQGNECWLILFKLWLWGLLFVAWGLVEWLRAFTAAAWRAFAAHWLVVALVIAGSAMLAARRRRAGE